MKCNILREPFLNELTQIEQHESIVPAFIDKQD